MGPPPPADSSPIIAVFRDHASAYAAVRDLRSAGIPGVNIGLAFSDAVIASPANDPATYRATGQSQDGSEIEDRTFRDSFRPPFDLGHAAMPNTFGYDRDFQARQYHNPRHQVMVSVQPETGQRQGIYDLLVRCGAAR